MNNKEFIALLGFIFAFILALAVIDQIRNNIKGHIECDIDGIKVYNLSTCYSGFAAKNCPVPARIHCTVDGEINKQVLIDIARG